MTLPPQLPSIILPVAWYERSDLPRVFRRAAMVHFLADLVRIQCEEDISVAMVTASLEDIMTHFLP